MQADLFEEQKPAPQEDPQAALYRQLVKLGDMLGDGMGDEPDGAWIKKEYRQVMKALGHKLPRKPRANHSVQINERMAQRVAEQPCLACGGTLKQIRSGSRKARCTSCAAGFTLLIVKKRTKTS